MAVDPGGLSSCAARSPVERRSIGSSCHRKPKAVYIDLTEDLIELIPGDS